MNRSSKNASGNFTNKDLNDSPFKKNMNGQDSNVFMQKSQMRTLRIKEPGYAKLAIITNKINSQF